MQHRTSCSFVLLSISCYLVNKEALLVWQEAEQTFSYWDTEEGGSFQPAECMQQMLEQVRRHRVNIDGDVCTVMVTMLVLEVLFGFLNVLALPFRLVENELFSMLQGIPAKFCFLNFSAWKFLYHLVHMENDWCRVLFVIAKFRSLSNDCNSFSVYHFFFGCYLILLV